MTTTTNCPSYYEIWMNYCSDEDNALMEKLSRPGWNGKECHRLIKLLYLGEISIEEFKEQFTAAGMDYNFVEHCCGCAGCYESESHGCPDWGRFEHEDYDPDTDERGGCGIRDPFYCDTCGEEIKTGTCHFVHVNKKMGRL